jgi:hypothetical protein
MMMAPASKKEASQLMPAKKLSTALDQKMEIDSSEEFKPMIAKNLQTASVAAVRNADLSGGTCEGDITRADIDMIDNSSQEEEKKVSVTQP